MALTDYLSAIADSIRLKDGTTNQIQAVDFPERILAIPSGGGLPETVKTGTFTVEQDTTETIIINHGIGSVPKFYFIMPDNLTDVIGKKTYAVVGGHNLNTSVKIVATNGGALAEKYNVSTIAVDSENFTLSIQNTAYSFKAGIVYRWYAWI